MRYDAVGEAVVSVLIGRQLEAVRAAALDPLLPAAMRQVAARAAATARRILCTDPRAVAEGYASDATSLGLQAKDLPQRRLAATLREAANLIEYDQAFLRRDGVLAQ